MSTWEDSNFSPGPTIQSTTWYGKKALEYEKTYLKKIAEICQVKSLHSLGTADRRKERIFQNVCVQ